MKIAVLTLSLYANYGGNLQAWAMLTALKDLGHDAWFLNRERHKVTPRRALLAVAKRMIGRVMGRRGSPNKDHFNQADRAIVGKHARRFIESRIQPQTPEFTSSRSLSRKFSTLGFDAVIVGSDQVWRQKFVKSNLTDYFCGFLGKRDAAVKRISYAASFGTSNWEYSKAETRRCAELARKFDAISVREDTGVQMCREHFGVSAEHVVDPTMLIERGRYLELIDDPEITSRGVLVYLLDEHADKNNIVDWISDALNLPSFKVNGNAANKAAPAVERVAPPVGDWLRGFRDADFVITDSFHGTVFAILFNKPFVAIGNATRGMARFSSLLSMFRLNDRLISTSAQLGEHLLVPPAWDDVNAELSAQRVKAREFLKRALA